MFLDRGLKGKYVVFQPRLEGEAQIFVLRLNRKNCSWPSWRRRKGKHDSLNIHGTACKTFTEVEVSKMRPSAVQLPRYRCYWTVCRGQKPGCQQLLQEVMDLP